MSSSVFGIASLSFTCFVTEPLQQPEVSLDQMSGVYLEGESATTTCTVNQDYHEIYFYRDYKQLTSRQFSITKNIATFAVYSQNNAGQYTCRYGIIIGKRQLLSQTSENVTLTVVGKCSHMKI